MQLSRQDIRRSFSHNAFRHALDYARDGNVLGVKPSRDGLTLKSEVFGSGYRPTGRRSASRRAET